MENKLMISSSDIVLSHSETIEVKTTAGTATYLLGQNNENIEKKHVVAIDVFSVNEIGVSPLSAPVVNSIAFKNAYLTLKIEGVEKISRIPLRSLCSALNGGKLRIFTPMKVSMSTSKIEVPGSTGIVSNEAFVLVFYVQ